MKFSNQTFVRILFTGLATLSAIPAFAGYECNTRLVKEARPTEALGGFTFKQATGKEANQLWGRLAVEKIANDGTVTAIELGGWASGIKGEETGKFSLYRNVYKADKKISEDFLRPIEVDTAYGFDRIVTIESYILSISCKVTE